MKEIFLRGGEVAIVDDEDYEYLSQRKWYLSGGYAVRYVPVSEGGPCLLAMHREILGLRQGDKDIVDHEDRNTLNNRRVNLRVCTNSQNLMNRGANANSKSGLKGVTFCKATGRWRATINTASSKQKHLGYFDNPKEAHEVYCLAADLLHGEFANHGIS